MSTVDARTDCSISLLTSSTDLSLDKIEDEFREEVGTAEVYAFRDGDLRDLGYHPTGHSVDLIAGWNEEDISRVAEEVRSAFPGGASTQGGSRLEPIGIATYLPQIASAFQERRAVTISALKNVLLLAADLGVRVVEIVCGRVAEHCCRSANGQLCDAVLYQHRHQGSPNKFTHLLDGLAQLTEFVRDRVKSRPGMYPLAVALEVEPGPLYIVNDLSRAKQILDQTADDSYVIPHMQGAYHMVGVNLDLGHMLICHRGKQRVLKDLGVPGSRIYNFHISDNAELHFADLVPGTIHSIDPEAPRSFADWLKCFLCACKRPSNNVFRRNISIELEACPSRQWAHQAIRNTKFMLNKLIPTHEEDTKRCRKHCSVWSD